MTIWLRWSIPDLLWDCAGGPWCWKATLLGYSPLIFGVVERAAMHAMPHSNLETIQNLLTRSPFEPDHIYINPNKNRADSYAVLNVTYCVFFSGSNNNRGTWWNLQKGLGRFAPQSGACGWGGSLVHDMWPRWDRKIWWWGIRNASWLLAPVRSCKILGW